MPVSEHGLRGKVQCILVCALLRGQTGQPVKGGALCFRAPGGLIEGIVSLFLLTVGHQGQTQVKPALSRIGIRILPRLLFNGSPEIRDAVFDTPSLIEQKTVAVIQTDIRGIPFQPLQIIIRRFKGGVTVLLQMSSGQIQFFRGLHFLRGFHRFRWLWYRLGLFLIDGVFH